MKIQKFAVLVLALVMAFSIISGAAATGSAYVDQNEIKYVEAVDVLSELNILEGSDGTFRPKDHVTRAEAAAIIARVALTRRIADEVAVDRTSRYTDMANSSWAIKYVETCSDMGIIHGIGNQKYDPSGDVTGYEFAKMLLAAAGYGQNEEFVGPGWSINVVRTALDVDLFAGADPEIELSEPATREECALYAFNLLTNVDLVNFASASGDYTSGAKPQTLGEKQYGLGCAVTEELMPASSNGFYQIGTVKLAGDLGEYLGRSIRVWYTRDAQVIRLISDPYCNDQVLGENHYGYTYAEMTNSKNPGFIAKAVPDADMQVYINGSQVDSNGNPYTVSDVAGKKGVKVTFVDTPKDGIVDGIADKVFVLEKQVAMLLEDPSVQNGSVMISGITDGYMPVERVIGHEDLAHGDVVLFWTDAEGFLRMEKADSFTGKLTGTKAVNGGMTYIIDDKTHHLSGLSGAGALTTSMYDASRASTASYQDFRYYVDDGGYIVAAVPENGTLSDYVVIEKLAVVKPQGVQSNAYLEALLVNMDGKEIPVRLASVTVNSSDSDKNGIADDSVRYMGRGSEGCEALNTADSRNDYVINERVAELVGSTFFTYLEAEDGYHLSSVYSKTVNHVETKVGSIQRTDGERNDIRNGVAGFAEGLVGTKTTKFIVYNKTKECFDVYEGISKVPNIELVHEDATAFLSVGGFVKYVFIGADAISDGSVIQEENIFLLTTEPNGDAFGNSLSDGYGIYTVVVNGELRTVKTRLGFHDIHCSENSEGPGYKNAWYEGDLIVHLHDGDSSHWESQKGFAVSNGVMTLGGQASHSYLYEADTPAFVVDTARSHEVTETTVSALVSDDNDDVCVVFSDPTAERISYVVIFENDAATAA